VHARAGRTSGGHGGIGLRKQAVGNARETLRAIIAVDRFPNFPISHTPSDFELHNGEYKLVSIDDRHSDVIIT